MPIIAGSVIGLGTGLYQAISGSNQQKRGQKAFEAAMAARPQYEISDTVKQQLAEAQARYNAQNPAIAMAYQQAQQGMANQMANAQRNASSGAQALAAGAGAQAQLQSIIPQLAQQQAAYNQQQYANLNVAQNAMGEEEMNQFRDQLAANQARQNFGLGLAQAGSAMKGQGLGALAQGGLGLAAAGLMGKFNKNNTTNGNTNPFPETPSNYDGTISGATAPVSSGVQITAPSNMKSVFGVTTSPFQVGVNTFPSQTVLNTSNNAISSPIPPIGVANPRFFATSPYYDPYSFL